MRRRLPDGFDEALEAIQEDKYANLPTQVEIDSLIYATVDWLADPRGCEQPEVSRSFFYTIREEDIEASFTWRISSGVLGAEIFDIRGGDIAKALSAHRSIERQGFRAEQLQRAVDLIFLRYEMLGAPEHLAPSDWTKASFPRLAEAIDAMNFHTTARWAESLAHLAPGDLDPDPEQTARVWWLLGYWTSIMETTTIRDVADGRTVSERSLMSFKADAARRRGGKIRGQHQSSEAKTLRAKILERAGPIRAAQPHLNDDDLIDAVRDKLIPKVGSSTVRSHIRALKRAGLLSGRRRT